MTDLEKLPLEKRNMSQDFHLKTLYFLPCSVKSQEKRNNWTEDIFCFLQACHFIVTLFFLGKRITL